MTLQQLAKKRNATLGRIVHEILNDGCGFSTTNATTKTDRKGKKRVAKKLNAMWQRGMITKLRHV